MSNLFYRTAGIAAHVLLALVFVNASAWAGDKIFTETATARWGADYSVFEAESAKVCHQKCSEEGSCMAWTFVTATKKNTMGECHLKNMAPHALPNPCCTSGVLIGQSAPSGDPYRSPMMEASAIELVPVPTLAAETLPAQEVEAVDEAVIPVLEKVEEPDDEEPKAEAAVIPAAVDAPISITPASFETP